MSTLPPVAIDLNGPGHYVHLVGPNQISLANLIDIILKLVVFDNSLLAFPRDKG